MVNNQPHQKNMAILQYLRDPPIKYGLDPNVVHNGWLTTNKIIAGVQSIQDVKMDVNDVNDFLNSCEIKGYVIKRTKGLDVKQAKAEWKIEDEGKRFLAHMIQHLEKEKWFFRK